MRRSTRSALQPVQSAAGPEIGVCAHMLGHDNVFAANTAVTAAEKFGDETVIIHFESGIYFALSNSGSIIWSMVQTPVTLGGLLDAVRSGGVTAPEVSSFVTEFVARLAEHDLIRDVGEPASAPIISGALDPATFASRPGLEVFTDLAALIAMDPVHEVDVLEGWPQRAPAP